MLENKNLKKQENLWNKAVNDRDINVSMILRKLTLDVIDVETVYPLGKQQFYDIGITSVKNNNQVAYTKSYIVSDIFDDPVKMASAYYKEKIPFYESKLLTDNSYEKLSAQETIDRIEKHFKDNDIRVYFAYNGSFDRLALINTYNEYYNQENPFLYRKVVDIMYLAIQIIIGNPDIYEEYMEFCYENKFITPSGKNISFSAQSVYAFLLNRPLFQENHTGLEDTFCEKDLLIMLVLYYENKYHKDLIIHCLKEKQTTCLLPYVRQGGKLNIEKAQTIVETRKQQKIKKKGFFTLLKELCKK